MATVFTSSRRYRVAVNSNDHPPAPAPGHVLVKGCEARFKLNCPEGRVEVWDWDGDWTLKHLNKLGGEIAEETGECCKVWSEIHG
jgi:hypothetical protein